MAKSIYETLTDYQTETSVPEVKDKDGNVIRKNFGTVQHSLPEKNLPTAEQFEDAEMLEDWARENGILHQCLQSGIQSRLIDYRAIFKQMPKKSDLENGIEWTPDFGQKAVDNAEWKIVTRPKTKKSDEQTAMEYLSKLSPEQLKAMLEKVEQ